MVLESEALVLSSCAMRALFGSGKKPHSLASPVPVSSGHDGSGPTKEATIDEVSSVSRSLFIDVPAPPAMNSVSSCEPDELDEKPMPKVERPFGLGLNEVGWQLSVVVSTW